MKILILSDLHLEVNGFTPGNSCADIDVVVLAGDITKPATAAVEWARNEPTFKHAKAIVFVPGVLEHWSSFPNNVVDEMRQAAIGSHVHILDSSELVVQGVRFLGLTLWTDYQLSVKTNVGLISNSQLSVEVGRKMIANYFHTFSTQVDFDEEDVLNDVKTLPTPEQLVLLHQESTKWLSQKLSEPFSGKTVVVSHHAPNRNSIDWRLTDDWTTPAAVNELPEEFFEVPSLWIHGRSNCDLRYEVKNCTVISNPRGPVPDRHWAGENRHFDPSLIVSL